jgi:hypothetical protein
VAAFENLAGTSLGGDDDVRSPTRAEHAVHAPADPVAPVRSVGGRTP